MVLSIATALSSWLRENVVFYVAVDFQIWISKYAGKPRGDMHKTSKVTRQGIDQERNDLNAILRIKYI